MTTSCEIGRCKLELEAEEGMDELTSLPKSVDVSL